MICVDCSTTKCGNGACFCCEIVHSESLLLTVNESAFIKRIGMNIDLNIVFVPNVQSIGDDSGGGAPVL